MFGVDEFDTLTSKYGAYASWAIWDYKNVSNLSVISHNVDQLHSKFVLLGLNISRPLTEEWSNFHSNDHARKLKYACNDNKLRGSYITDIFKGIVAPRSGKLTKFLTDKIIADNVHPFNEEMKDIKINQDTQFIVFGTKNSLLASCFDRYFKQSYKNPVIYYYHYSYFTLTDKKWVTGFWNKLNIDQDYDMTREKYNSKHSVKLN